LGAQAMVEALEIHRSGALRDTGPEDHLRALMDTSKRLGCHALSEALRQRYPQST